MGIKDFGKKTVHAAAVSGSWLVSIRDKTKDFTKSLTNKEYRLEKTLKEHLGYGPTDLTFNPETKETLRSLAVQIQQISSFQDMDASSIGYPNVSVDAVLAAHHKMITDVFAAAGMTEIELRRFLLPTIRSLASFVHLIPASGGYHHKECGGLFQHSLETAWVAGQKAKGFYFASEPNSPNHSETQRKWILAVMLGALCHDCGKVLSDVVIRDESIKGKKFSPYSGSLSQWLQGIQRDRYYVYWKGEGKEHESELVHLYRDLISQPTNEYLGDRISFELSQFFRGKLRKGESLIADIITEADSESTAMDRGRGQFDRSHTSRFDRECANFFAAVKRLLLLGSKYHTENGEAYETTVKGVRICGWSVNTPCGALMLCPGQKLFVSWEHLSAIRQIYDIERVNSAAMNTGQVLPSGKKNEAALDPEAERLKLDDELFALVTQLYNGGYVLLNEKAGSYLNMQFFWRVGHYSPARPGDEIQAYKAICLNAKAINEIFRDTRKPPSEVAAYALFQSDKPNDGILVFKNSTEAQAHETAHSNPDAAGTDETASGDDAGALTVTEESKETPGESETPDSESADPNVRLDEYGNVILDEDEEQDGINLPNEKDIPNDSEDEEDSDEEDDDEKDAEAESEEDDGENESSELSNEEDAAAEDSEEDEDEDSEEDSEEEKPDYSVDEDGVVTYGSKPGAEGEETETGIDLSGPGKKKTEIRSNGSSASENKEQKPSVAVSPIQMSLNLELSPAKRTRRKPAQTGFETAPRTALESVPGTAPGIAEAEKAENATITPDASAVTAAVSSTLETPPGTPVIEIQPQKVSVTEAPPPAVEEPNSSAKVMVDLMSLSPKKSSKKKKHESTDAQASEHKEKEPEEKEHAAVSESAVQVPVTDVSEPSNDASEAHVQPVDSRDAVESPVDPRTEGADSFSESQNIAAPSASAMSPADDLGADPDVLATLYDCYVSESLPVQVEAYLDYLEDVSADDYGDYLGVEEPPVQRKVRRPWKLYLYTPKDEDGNSIQYCYEFDGHEPADNWSATVLIPENYVWPYEPNPKYKVKRSESSVSRTISLRTAVEEEKLPESEPNIETCDSSEEKSGKGESVPVQDEADTSVSSDDLMPVAAQPDVPAASLVEEGEQMVSSASDSSAAEPSNRLPFDLTPGETLTTEGFIEAVVRSLKIGKATDTMLLNSDPVRGFYLEQSQLQKLATLAAGSRIAEALKFEMKVRVPTTSGDLGYDELEHRVYLRSK